MLISSVFKAKARAALKQHWQTALLIALIVNLPTLLVQGLASFTGSDALARTEEMLLQASAGNISMDTLTGSLQAMMAESGVIAMAGLGILAWLVTPALAAGMDHWTLERLRGRELPVSAVFSRLRIFFKSIGLRLLIILKVLLWMLPGFAVSLVSVFFIFRSAPQTTEDLLSAANLSTQFMSFGIIAMLVLGIMGYLYCAIADLILADEPEEGALSCIRRSKTLMKGRRGKLMSLMLSFLLWYLLIIILSSVVGEISGSVVAILAEMLGSLSLSVYMLAAKGAFYEALRKMPLPDIPADQPPADSPDSEL